jgi:outer membrane receptor protein involved in Fe transport
MKSHAVAVLVMLVVSVVSCSLSVFAQGDTATINGRVTDPSGSVIVGAKVQLVNASTNVTYPTETNEIGLFNIPALSPGTYRVSVEKEGFAQVNEPGIVLHLGDIIALNFALQIGSVTQSVTVGSAAPLVDTTTSSLGGLVTGDKIDMLPLNGRNYIDLSLLQSGVAKHQSQASASGESGTFLTINGATPRSNYFTLDGGNIGNFLGMTSGSFAGTTLGEDGIQEYKVITNSFSADYGMSMGSQVVIVSKGGTNQFHGDMFDYLRNSALDARNYFDVSTAVNNFQRLPAFKRNNFGASFGGPIKKSKTFFYAVYEGLRQSLGVTILDQVFSSSCYDSNKNLLLTNNPCAVTPSNPNGNVAPTMQKLAQLLPAPNVGTSQFTFPGSDPTSVNHWQIRGDHIFSASDSFFARYTTDRANYSNTEVEPCGCAFPQFRKGGVGTNQFVTLAETHLFSTTLLNTVRFSFGRTNSALTRIFPEGTASLTSPGLSFITGQPVGILNIAGLSAFGPPTGAPQHQDQNVYSLMDDVYLTKGKHSLKFGTLINRFNESFFTVSQGGGNAAFTSVANFLNGLYLYYLAPLSNPSGFYVFNTYGFYAQDDWRVTPRLTLNLGLRYEPRTSPNETSNNQYSLRNPSTDATTTRGQILRNPSLYNFSPRLGFAWDVTGKGKTAIRGAFGVYYDLANLAKLFSRLEEGLPPISTSGQHTSNSTQLMPIPFTFQPSDVGTSLHAGDYHAGQPRDLQGNLTVEQQLPGGVGLSVSYVGLRGVSLWTTIDGNPVPPTSLANGVEFWGGPAINAGCANNVLAQGQPPPVPFPCRVNPHWGVIKFQATVGDSWYNSLQVNVIKKLSQGLEFQAAYTWSKNLDTSSGIEYAADCLAPGGTVSLDPIWQRSKAPACDDIKHNLRFNLLYRFPTIKSESFVSKILNGWWMGNIVSVESGYPFSPLVAGQRSNSGWFGGDQGDMPDYVKTATTVSLPDPNNPGNNVNVNFVPYNKNTVITGNPNEWFNVNMFQLGPIGYLGNVQRNLLRGPGLGTWDFSLVKDTAIRALGEKGSLQFRAEFFNILNRANFDIPLNGYIYPGNLTDVGPFSEAPIPSAAAITDTVTTSRQIQFALKVIF